MASELKFEFLRRWGQLGKLIFPDPTAEQEQFIQGQEANARDLEDYLNGLTGGGGGTAQSLIATYQAIGDWENTGNGTHDITISIPVPDDPDFEYVARWDINGLYSQSLETNAVINIQGQCGFDDFTNVAGWDTLYAFANSVTTGFDWFFSHDDWRFRPNVSGHSSRNQYIPQSVHGDTVTLRASFTFFSNSATYIGSNIKKGNLQVLLFALPGGSAIGGL